jgi:regulatory protein
MKITSISTQKRDSNRVNISVDGKYRFSLDAYQVVELGIKVGQECDESEIVALEQEGQFGKIYSRALEYCLMRPHSAREVRDYLYRKSRPTRDKVGKLHPGVASEIIERVFEILKDKGYIDDSKFAHYWVENRSLAKGISRRKLIAELLNKGLDNMNIDQALAESERCDSEEIKKVIVKKRSKYPDDKKLMAYLVGLGFGYGEIIDAIEEYSNNLNI